MVKLDNLIKLESEEFYFIFRPANIKALSKTNETYQVSLTNEQPIIDNDCSFFFHSNAFIERDDSVDTKYLNLYRRNYPVATFPFVCRNNTVSSLPKSPFGAINATADTTKKELAYLTEQLIKHCQAEGLQTIRITSYPRVYSPIAFDEMQKAFFDVGFEISTDTSQYLPIDKEFRKTVKPSERRYLNHATKEGYVFSELSIDNLSQAYKLIKDSRENKGYPVTMSFTDLKTTIEQFPTNYFIFGLFHNDILIATSVCIRINSKILYNFYLGDNILYRKKSPAVPLLKEIYNYARDNNYSTLDLGLSTENGVINKGLFNFKESLGALATEKPTYILSL